MAYLSSLFSPNTYETFSRSDRSLSGFSKQQITAARKVQVGDRFVCYMTKLSRWVGVLEVLEECVIDEKPLYHAENDPYVVRFKVQPIVWLSKELSLPIRDPEIWNSLTFTKDADQRSSTWTAHVRSNLKRLNDEDGEFLLNRMLAQAAGGKTYPVDEEDYRRLIVQMVRVQDKVVPVTVPSEDEPATAEDTSDAEGPKSVRESAKIQALLAQAGEMMGYKVWIPKADLPPVLEEWTPGEGTLVKALPLNYDEVTLRTIELIDVLWLKGRSIVRAFEVEHTTAVYSGILRMADLLALQPNMDIDLHIVAPEARRDKVMREIQRPVFSLLERGPLSETCTYLSYDSVREIAGLKHLQYLSDRVLDEYAERPE